MTARRVLRMGHPLLREISHPVTEFNTPELKTLIEDMLDTMHKEDGAGLAAPQIGVLLRVVVFGLDGTNERYLDRGPVPVTVLINPSIQVLDEETEDDWEGCLSVPGMRGLVPRFKHIAYSGFDVRGDPIQLEVSGFHARVVQHEYDHIDGILYPQRIIDMSQFGFVEELSS